MLSLKGEPTIGDVRSLHVECGDCGRERWLKQNEMVRGQVRPQTTLRAYMDKLVCADCRDEGLSGRNLVAVPRFYDRKVAFQAEAWMTNIQAARPTG
jgi:uncharacterized protein with PIN domain